MKLEKQYNGEPARIMNELFASLSKKSTKDFRRILGLGRSKKTLLDVGCGEGSDISYYLAKDLIVHGIDLSEDFITSASKKNPKAFISNQSSEKMNYPNSYFDYVVSKYVLQTNFSFERSYSEIARILKTDGTFQFLIAHPFRQYFEKKNIYADYFKQEIVDSKIFNNSFIVQEPSHTLQEVFSKRFITLFDIEEIFENEDFPASEQVDGRIYPTYLIVKAKKR